MKTLFALPLLLLANGLTAQSALASHQTTDCSNAAGTFTYHREEMPGEMYITVRAGDTEWDSRGTAVFATFTNQKTIQVVSAYKTLWSATVSVFIDQGGERAPEPVAKSEVTCSTWSTP